MFLLVGLGNPGSKYQFTRHNFGFLLLDFIIKQYQFKLESEKFLSQIFSGKIGEEKIISIKPQNYINCSGAAVLAAKQFYKIPKSKIIIFHDDLDLALGKIKIKIGGGNAGHNGLKDIDEKIGVDYMRIRLGIGRPENMQQDISDYVLGKFNEEEMKIIGDITQKITASFPLILKGHIDDFFNKL